MGNTEFCFPETSMTLRSWSSNLLYLQSQNRKKTMTKRGWSTTVVAQISCGFKEHDLITCESKVQVIVRPREVVIHDT